MNEIKGSKILAIGGAGFIGSQGGDKLINEVEYEDSHCETVLRP